MSVDDPTRATRVAEALITLSSPDVHVEIVEEWGSRDSEGRMIVMHSLELVRDVVAIAPRGFTTQFHRSVITITGSWQEDTP